jgi:hypothetical protein
MISSSSFESAPYDSLLPIIRVLERHGSVAVDGGFLNSPAGWYCRMSRSIDFEREKAECDLPRSVDLAEEYDTIIDRSTWCSILGPGSDGY